MKKYLLSLSFFAVAMCMMAQSGTNSPYSMFGLGKLGEQSIGASRGMNGVGLAFREHNQVNTLNPASYSAIDSTTFIFDIAMSMQNTNYKEFDIVKMTNVAKNAKNADFEYAVGLFRLVKHVGMSFGILPYSNVGYSFFSKSDPLANYYQYPSTTATTYKTNTYSGSGGLHEIFLGVGWATPLKGFSIGMNAGYLWGSIDRYSTSGYNDSDVRSLAKQFDADAHTYKLDFGAQYTHSIGKDYQGTIGLTFSPGHTINSEADCIILSANTNSSVTDSICARADNVMAMPNEIGVGLALAHKRNWKVGFDYKYQGWGSCAYPVYKESDGVPYYGYDDNESYYSDRHIIKLGGEYCKNEYGRDFFSRIRYRLGVGYSSNYLKINGFEGPREISVSGGFGIPIINAYNNRSILNISFSWQNYRAADFITENTLMLTIGMTFNERWFAKWKFE